MINNQKKNIENHLNIVKYLDNDKEEIAQINKENKNLEYLNALNIKTNKKIKLAKIDDKYYLYNLRERLYEEPNLNNNIISYYDNNNIEKHALIKKSNKNLEIISAMNVNTKEKISLIKKGNQYYNSTFFIPINNTQNYKMPSEPLTRTPSFIPPPPPPRNSPKYTKNNPPPPPPPRSSSPILDAKYNKYIKMQKVGLSSNMIEHKMTADGLSKNEITIFLSNKSSSSQRNIPPPPPRNRQPISSRNNISSNEVSEVNLDPKYKKYANMLKRGIPKNAVKQKMKVDEFSNTNVKKFFKENDGIKKLIKINGIPNIYYTERAEGKGTFKYYTEELSKLGISQNLITKFLEDTSIKKSTGPLVITKGQKKINGPNKTNSLMNELKKKLAKKESQYNSNSSTSSIENKIRKSQEEKKERNTSPLQSAMRIRRQKIEENNIEEENEEEKIKYISINKTKKIAKIINDKNPFHIIAKNTSGKNIYLTIKNKIYIEKPLPPNKKKLIKTPIQSNQSNQSKQSTNTYMGFDISMLKQVQNNSRLENENDWNNN
jgi:hypothetical protein